MMEYKTSSKGNFKVELKNRPRGWLEGSRIVNGGEWNKFLSLHKNSKVRQRGVVSKVY